MDNPTPEETARHYSTMMDSVHVINSLVPTADVDDLDTLDRNVRHLEHMLERDWWDGYDLAPINAAITAGKQ
jgi:hypothetical protein